MNEWMNEWLTDWLNEWMNEWMNAVIASLGVIFIAIRVLRSHEKLWGPPRSQQHDRTALRLSPRFGKIPITFCCPTHLLFVVSPAISLRCRKTRSTRSLCKLEARNLTAMLVSRWCHTTLVGICEHKKSSARFVPYGILVSLVILMFICLAFCVLDQKERFTSCVCVGCRHHLPVPWIRWLEGKCFSIRCPSCRRGLFSSASPENVSVARSFRSLMKLSVCRVCVNQTLDSLPHC